MKKFSALLTFLILVGLLCVPTVSATEIINTTIVEYTDTSDVGELNYLSGGENVGAVDLTGFYIKDVSLFDEISYFTLTADKTQGFWSNGELIPQGRHETTYTYNGITQPAVVYVTRNTNLLGEVISTEFIFFPQNWDRQQKSGFQVITTPVVFLRADVVNYVVWSTGRTDCNIGLVNSAGKALHPRHVSSTMPVQVSHATAITWENILSVETTDDEIKGYDITLTRTVNGISAYSTMQLFNNDSLVYYNSSSADISIWYAQNAINKINVTSPVSTRSYILNSEIPDEPDEPDEPDNTTVTVYVRNSQTGALLANAHINISANVNGNFHEVVNKTAPSGIYSIELQPTGGGMPNPDFYRLIPTADGYNSVMPYIDFNVDGETTIYAYMDPIAGGPLDENKTFIDFFVRDLAANPISGATVNFGGYTLLTNSQGYTVFEVDINKAYTWTVSKSGYGSLTGKAVIGADDRYTVNSVLGPAVTPTKPTAIPTSTPIGPSPTLTAPTGEPVSNLLEWFAAHFGMVLGGGVEIGKLFMWLCFTVPVGVYVGKQAKAGAAGFMAGAGIVTLFFVLIGWVPIWLVVLLALIIGLLYAKVFNNDNGGGGR